jgi:U4/U6.U5 tri-snRNP-associated protein 1
MLFKRKILYLPRYLVRLGRADRVRVRLTREIPSLSHGKIERVPPFLPSSSHTYSTTTPQQPPIMDAAAIEQMNKMRVSLGMAPLPVPGGGAGPEFKQKDDADSESEEDNISTLDKRQAAAGDNWQRLEAERQEKVDREKRKEAAKKAREASQRNAKLEGKGLGDADEGDELDTRAWLMQQKKRQKKIEKARKMEAELAEREREMMAEYTSKDLAGVKVAHEADQFDEMTGEQILTLKDADIGADSEDDELENQELNAKDKLEEKLRLLKKRPDYDPTEQEEVKGVLSKYDEEIDGKQAKRFTLDGKGSTVESKRKALEANGEGRSKGVKINLDIFQDEAPVSDYVDPSMVKVKKPKKQKKEKKTRQKATDEDDIFPVPEQTTAPQADNNAMDIDITQNNPGVASKKRTFDFEDDDDLQAKLAEQRRQALKKRKKMDGAELARQMREEMPVDEEELEEGGLTIDETTEFVANLKKPEEREDDSDRERRVRQQSHGPSAANAEDEDGDEAMAGQSYAEVADAEERATRASREVSTPAAEATTTGLDEEDSMSGQGMAASLNLLRKRGLVSDGAGGEIAERDRKRNKFLADKQSLIEEFDQRARDQREAERHSGRWEKMSNRERDEFARRQNEMREQYLSKLQAEMFNREYRPDVKLQYHDEFGRSMNQKEAFKHLSHMFHGKGSGKQKTEKRLKKIDDEKRNMAKGVLNVGDEGGMMNVQGREGKRQKTAGVRLQ